MVTKYCKFGCCYAQFCPLTLAWAGTLHSFQGLQAGPRNQHKKILCDLGTLQFERSNPGLGYMTIARATTLGTNNRNSALYFIGNSVSEDRLRWLTTPKDSNKKYVKIQQREDWMNHIKKQQDIWIQKNPTSDLQKTLYSIKNNLKLFFNVDIDKLLYG